MPGRAARRAWRAQAHGKMSGAKVKTFCVARRRSASGNPSAPPHKNIISRTPRSRVSPRATSQIAPTFGACPRHPATRLSRRNRAPACAAMPLNLRAQFGELHFGKPTDAQCVIVKHGAILRTPRFPEHDQCESSMQIFSAARANQVSPYFLRLSRRVFRLMPRICALLPIL